MKKTSDPKMKKAVKVQKEMMPKVASTPFAEGHTKLSGSLLGELGNNPMCLPNTNGVEKKPGRDDNNSRSEMKKGKKGY